LLVGQGWVGPLEFWKLAPGQVWWIIESKMPADAQPTGGDMTEIRNMVKAAKAKEAAHG